MGLITQIRKNGSWIMVILIALGVGGFILMDMTVGQTSVFGSAQPTLGKINGQKIDVRNFTNTESLLGSSADPLVRRNSLWEFMVEEILMKGEADAIGLGISDAELTELQFGNDPSPIVRQRFVDPNTQQLDRAQLNQIRQLIESNTADAQLKGFWSFQEREVIKDRLQSKLSAMVAKAIYTPTWMAEQTNRDQTTNYSVQYVQVPFDAIDNADVALEDSDFEAYIKENAATLKNDEEKRRIAFVSFDVSASAADSAAYLKSLQDLYAEFDTTANDSIFIQQNLGAMDKAYFTKDQLPPAVADTLLGLSVGTVYGPYLEGNTYQLVKIIDRKIIPDSVRARHILLPAQDAATLQAAQTRIDSIKKAIEGGGGTFAELAQKFGTDATATKGGDLGFAAQGMMVKPFNDLIFFEAEQGKLYSVITEFGVHLVEVTDKKFTENKVGLRVALLSKAIFPSEETRNNRYDEVLTFLSKARTLEVLRKEATSRKLTLETAPAVGVNDVAVGSLGTSQQSRDIIKWAFESAKGSVSSSVYVFSDAVNNYDNRYVVAALEGIQKKGLPEVADVRSSIEPLVINRKKGEMIQQKIKGKDLNGAATAYGVQVQSLENVTFASTFLPNNIGNEPKFLGYMAGLAAGKTSVPFTGNSGVFMVKVLQKSGPQPMTNLPDLRNTLSSGAKSQATVTLMESMRKNAKIQDRRARFF
jgi:peptidyl-prolyl cis-trans isomerase D